jgi:hypothetical protein
MFFTVILLFAATGVVSTFDNPGMFDSFILALRNISTYLLPTEPGTYDIGSDEYRFNNFYANTIDLESDATDSVVLTIQATPSQSANLTRWLATDDSVIARVTKGGKIQSTAGFRSVANQWGDSLIAWPYGYGTAEHSNLTGSYDYTGGLNEKILSCTTSIFTQDDSNFSNIIVLKSGTYLGAKAEINDYISATQVTVHTTTWTGDFSDITFDIFNHPQILSSDGFHTFVCGASDGHVHIHGYDRTSSEGYLLEVEANMIADDEDTMHIHHDAGGHGNTDALHIFYQTNGLETGDDNQVIQVSVDESDATAGEVDCLFIETTDAQANLEKYAIHIGTGFDYALSVAGATQDDPGYGYEVTSGTVVDRVNSGGVGDTAFIDSAVNQTLMDNDNDYILIGSSTTFEVIEVNLATVSSRDCELLFYYSKAGGNWTSLTADDSTAGFTKSGLIDFSAPTDWTADDEAEVNADITNAYYVKIVRTVGGVIPTLPVEARLYTYLEQSGDTGMEVRGNGVIKLPYLAASPSTVNHGLIWMEDDGLHVYYNNAERVVSDGAP